VWAVGYYMAGGVLRPLVAILDKDLNIKRPIQLPGYFGHFGSICFDREGNAYVGGNRTVTKFDNNRNYIERYSGDVYVSSIMCVKDMLYLFGYVPTTTNSAWQLVYEIIDAKTMERIR